MDRGVVPRSERDPTPARVVLYDLVSRNPYKFTPEDLTFELHVRKPGPGRAEVHRRRAELWAGLSARSHPCLRACVPAKRFGWGLHVNADGKVALYGRESAEYHQFTEPGPGQPTLAVAPRNKRA